MTVQNFNACRGGVCEPTAEGDFLFIENETYCAYEFKTFKEAKKVFDAYKVKYLHL